MKQLFYILFAIIFSIGCKKETQPVLPIDKSSALSNDNEFVVLMDAMKRFDPLYVDIVYRKDQHHTRFTKEDFLPVNEQTTEEAFINNLTNHYYFKNKEEVLLHSTIIQEGLTKLFNTYLAGLTTKEQAIIYFKARKLYAQNKLSKKINLGNENNVRSMSFDMPIAEDDYYRVITEEQDADDNLTGNNYHSGCTDVCCINKKICVNNAYIKFLENMKFIAGAAVAGGGLGFKLGSLFGGPQIGAAVAIIGGVYGAAATTAIYYLTYSTEKENCDLNYRICLQKT
ncbi:MAG: hypothetical protein WCP74_02100 [Sphingobacteriia bacterium]